jgi:septum formation protein
VQAAQIDESQFLNENPIAYVTRLAREKAETVLQALGEAGIEAGVRGEGEPVVVLGADTTVTLDDQILGKPEDAADAARMLRLLAGRTHRVITGVAVVTAQTTEVAAEVTGVQFLTLSEEEIAAYVATGEPMDKAGGYGIQGRAARWIPRIEGCYFNVVGLPLALVTNMLGALGLTGDAAAIPSEAV